MSPNKVYKVIKMYSLKHGISKKCKFHTPKQYASMRLIVMPLVTFNSSAWFPPYH